MIAYLDKSAVISACGRYRYRLTRTWEASKPVLGVGMLNPSTADGEQDDPTIRKVVGFADRWGFGGILIANLFAWRATDPKALRGVIDPIGPENDLRIAEVAAATHQFVAGWGALNGPPWLRHRADRVLRGLTETVDVYAFRITSKGMPEHPLYLPGDLHPVLYRERRKSGMTTRRTNAQRLAQVERGLAGAVDEYDRAWWQERADYCRLLVERDGPDVSTTITSSWRGELAAWRSERDAALNNGGNHG